MCRLGRSSPLHGLIRGARKRRKLPEAPYVCHECIVCSACRAASPFSQACHTEKTSASQKSDGSMRYISHWAHIENIEISSTPPAYGHATTSKYIIFRLFELPSFHWHLAAPVSCPVVSLVLTMSWSSPHETISCFAISLFLFRHVLMCIWCVLDLSAQVFSQWHFAWGNGHWGRVEEPPSYEVSIAVDVA